MSAKKPHFWLWLGVALVILSAISILAWIFWDVGFFFIFLAFPLALGVRRR